MRLFKPTKRFTLNNFLEKYDLFRFKIISDKIIRAEYFLIKDPNVQYFRIITGEELSSFKSCAGYVLGIRNPEYKDGFHTGYYIFNPSVKKTCKRKNKPL